MIKRVTKTIPAKTEERQVGLICDSCGKHSRQYDSWGEGGYDVEEVAISYKSGSSYPEGGSGEEFVVDLCPECFQTKLMPALEGLGIIGRTDEWDW